MNHNDQTLALHAGHNTTKTEGTRAVPIYQTTSYVFDNTDHAANLFSLAEPGYIYTRLNNPTADILEQRLASLEGGIAAVATSSGSAALATTLLTLLKTGDHILMTDSAYGVSRNLAKKLLNNMGITTTFYNPNLTNKIKELITNKTKLIFMESPGSLTFEIQNISMIVDIAKKYNLITVIDNTWATSLYLKPMNYGVDISIQSATKYIVGHSDAMLGVITTNKKYAKQIRESAHNLGSCPGPEDIYLGIRGLKTLSIRLKKHQENAMKIIEWFLRQREVNRVLYPALPDNPGYKIWKKDFKGASGLFGVVLENTRKDLIYKMLNNLKLFNMGYSWGGYESLILPVNPEKIRDTYKWNHMDLTLRIHAGLEDPEDLINDLKDNFNILKID